MENKTPDGNSNDSATAFIACTRCTYHNDIGATKCGMCNFVFSRNDGPVTRFDELTKNAKDCIDCNDSAALSKVIGSIIKDKNLSKNDKMKLVLVSLVRTIENKRPKMVCNCF